MSRTATATALIPEPHCVLGTLLRPFSLGHHLLLTKLGSPYAGHPAAVGFPEQLALAVFVCAAAYSESLASLLRGDWEKDFAAWTRKLRPRWWQRTRFSHARESEKFAAYLAAGYAKAPVWRHPAAAAVLLSAPEEQLLKCRLVAAGFTEAEVLEKFLPAAWYDYWTVIELQQIADCNSPAKWQKIFYTAEDDARLHPVPPIIQPAAN